MCPASTYNSTYTDTHTGRTHISSMCSFVFLWEFEYVCWFIGRDILNKLREHKFPSHKPRTRKVNQGLENNYKFLKTNLCIIVNYMRNRFRNEIFIKYWPFWTAYKANIITTTMKNSFLLYKLDSVSVFISFQSTSVSQKWFMVIIHNLWIFEAELIHQTSKHKTSMSVLSWQVRKVIHIS